jgi:5-methylcytosine-specific restriction endonuclease McrA
MNDSHKRRNIAEGVKKSWQDPEVKAARIKHDPVIVHEKGVFLDKYSSTWQAFKALGLSANKHQQFRKKLKTAGSLDYSEGSKVYEFKICDETSVHKQTLSLSDLPSNPDSRSLASWYEESERRVATLDRNELARRAAMASPVPHKIELAATTAYVRDPYVAAYAKILAKGDCDLCTKPAPFLTVNAEPYLESHHVTWLSRGGYDLIENVVALCPNCHRKMHSRDEEADREHLLYRISTRHQL